MNRAQRIGEMLSSTLLHEEKLVVLAQAGEELTKQHRLTSIAFRPVRFGCIFVPAASVPPAPPAGSGGTRTPTSLVPPFRCGGNQVVHGRYWAGTR
jgi:hypothetical protein